MSTGVVTVNDTEKVLDSLSSGDPVTLKDAVLRPVASQKRKKLIDNLNHLEVQLGRLAKTAREMRADIASLTVE